MKQAFIKILLALMLMFIPVGCRASGTLDVELILKETVPNTVGMGVETPPTLTPPPFTAPTSTGTPLPTSDGPTLLIQTDFNAYHIINFGFGITYPFDPPWEDNRFRLSDHLSPSWRQILFPRGERQVLIMDLATGLVHTTYQLSSESPLFRADQTAEEARQSTPGLDYTPQALLRAVEAAYAQSKLNIQWYMSDNFRLSVLDGSETSTQLYLDNHQTGMRDQLENAPGLVEDYWVGPDGENILLKKGTIFDPGIWEDDRYYLVDIDDKTAQSIPLLDGVEHPALFWLSPGHLGIIHQTQPVGGIDFSVFNIETQEAFQVVRGAFSHIRMWDEVLLIMQHDQDADTTLIEVKTLEGEIVQSKEIEERCFFHAALGERFVLNCNHESLLVNTSLEAELFDDPLFITAKAPDGDKTILVTRAGDTYILNNALQERQDLTLEGEPLEVRWLPDSSGFLYRANQRLYIYHLESGESQLLFTSDIFGDYSNLNAVWVNLN